MPSDDQPDPTETVLPSGTVTFVLTDIEGSTNLWDDEPGPMALAHHQHDELVAAAVAAHSGRLVKSKGEGDSTFSVFVDPTDAVSAAEEMRDSIRVASWPTASPIRVRIGVLTGVAELRDGDYYGAAVNRAARVRSLAHGGEILLAASTYSLIADSLLRDRAIEDRGEHELRGLQRPERVYALQDRAGGAERTGEPGHDWRAGRRRSRLLAWALIGVLLVGGLGWYLVAKPSKRHSAVAVAGATTTSAALVATKPSVEIGSIELVSSPYNVRYEVSGTSSRIDVPPYEIRILARAPDDTKTWLWSPSAKVGANGGWTGTLDVPTVGPSHRLRLSAVAILADPGGTTPGAGSLPLTGPRSEWEEQLLERGPTAKGVIAVSAPK